MLRNSTLTFLSQLETNNNKPWFDTHKAEYVAAKNDVTAWIASLLKALSIGQPAFSNVKAKDCVFRIYRDIRFSKDKTPYKTHFAAGISTAGRKVSLPGYYVHIAPGGNSFIGGGIWHPDAPALKKIRQEIDYHTDEFLSLLNAPQFKRCFGTPADKESLLRPPRGYEAGHPAIRYLKMKNFIVAKNIPDRLLTDEGLEKETIHLLSLMQPFLAFLQRALS